MHNQPTNKRTHQYTIVMFTIMETCFFFFVFDIFSPQRPDIDKKAAITSPIDCEVTYDSPTMWGAKKATPMGARSKEPIMPGCGAELPIDYLRSGPPTRHQAGRIRMHNWNAGRNPHAPLSDSRAHKISPASGEGIWLGQESHGT